VLTAIKITEMTDKMFEIMSEVYKEKTDKEL
jgi:hypothetical protein